MFSFRQKIFVSYLTVFLIFIVLMFPLCLAGCKKLFFNPWMTRATEIIANIKDAPNNDALVRRLKDQKA